MSILLRSWLILVTSNQEQPIINVDANFRPSQLKTLMTAKLGINWWASTEL